MANNNHIATILDVGSQDIYTDAREYADRVDLIRDAINALRSSRDAHCRKCGWQFTVHEVPDNPAYAGCDWFCPHCGKTAKTIRRQEVTAV